MKHVLEGRYPPKAMKALFPLDDYRTNPSPAMDAIFSEENTFKLWADCEIYLAEAQNQIGLAQVTQGYISALRRSKPNLDISAIRAIERSKKHDVMSFVTHYAELADKIEEGAGGIIHLGATSCYVTDNTELMQQRDALAELQIGMNKIILYLKTNAPQREDLQSTISYAHRQLMGRRMNMKARGAKGTTGTQASHMELFGGDYEKVDTLDEIVVEKMGFDASYDITGQTYPRIADFQMLSTLGLAAKALKPLMEDLLDGLERSEVLEEIKMYDDLAALEDREFRQIEANVVAAAQMASTQWLERSLDDSSERRMLMRDTFLALDNIIRTLIEGTEWVDVPYNTSKSTSVNEVREQEREGLDILLGTTVNVLNNMNGFASQYKDLPCLAYTHYQVAQPTTHGKRISMWMQNYVLAIEELENLMHADFGDGVAKEVLDYQAATTATCFAIASATKAADMRLLQHDMELAEPFAKEQKGSSAMPHKRNPMKQERVCGLARNAINALNTGDTESLFLSTGSVLQLDLATFVTDTEKQRGFTIFEPVVERNLIENLPYLAAEPVMMGEVERGRSRQVMHEILKDCSTNARDDVVAGNGNTMFDQMRAIGIEISSQEEARLLNPQMHIGAAPQQVEMFNLRVILPLLDNYADLITDKESEVQV